MTKRKETMGRLIGILVLLIVSSGLYAQQYVVMLPPTVDYSEVPGYASVDYVGKDGIRVYVYGEDNFRRLTGIFPEYKLVQKNKAKVLTMASTFADLKNGWDKYPTYDAYLEAMQYFANNYPDLCRLDTIGTTQEGRLLLAVRITDNPDILEAEPQFFYTSSMHGDEVTGYVLMLRLIDTLLSGYGNNDFITKLVDSLDIYINPLANPDGTYHGGDNDISGAMRYYSNGSDPNREFGDPVNGQYYNQSPETKAMIAWQREHNFVMSANFHGGAEVYNYPWDIWTSTHAHADDAWYRKIGQAYVDTARLVDPNYMTNVESTGVTEGGDWYVISGSRQDYSNYFLHTREVTIELSTDKLLSSDQLPLYWDINSKSLMWYMLNAWKGIYGQVTGENGSPQQAYIHIIGHDKDNSEVLSRSQDGWYFRPLLSGTYQMVAYTDSFVSDTVTVFFDGQNPVRTDFVLKYEKVTGESLNNIVLYPNPTNGVVIFGAIVPKVTVYSFSGQKVFSRDNVSSIDLGALPGGIYLLVLSDSNGYTNAKKIILRH